jgi:hypothetical protein
MTALYSATDEDDSVTTEFDVGAFPTFIAHSLVKHVGGHVVAYAPLYSTSDVATELGIDSSRVRRLAEKHGIGVKVNDRAWVFTDADIGRLRAISTGRAGRPKRSDQ